MKIEFAKNDLDGLHIMGKEEGFAVDIDVYKEHGAFVVYADLFEDRCEYVERISNNEARDGQDYTYFCSWCGTVSDAIVEAMGDLLHFALTDNRMATYRKLWVVEFVNNFLGELLENKNF